MTKAAENLIPGGALDWDDVKKCDVCGVQHCIDELEEIEGELTCGLCALSNIGRDYEEVDRSKNGTGKAGSRIRGQAL